LRSAHNCSRLCFAMSRRSCGLMLPRRGRRRAGSIASRPIRRDADKETLLDTRGDPDPLRSRKRVRRACERLADTLLGRENRCDNNLLARRAGIGLYRNEKERHLDADSVATLALRPFDYFPIFAFPVCLFPCLSGAQYHHMTRTKKPLGVNPGAGGLFWLRGFATLRMYLSFHSA
jgi:hypothetical protein